MSLLLLFNLNKSPTVALNTPADAATVVTLTPTVNFTGTDNESNAVEYQVQISQRIGFDVNTYFFNASDAGPVDPDANWTNDANAVDGSTATTATSAAVGSKTSKYLGFDGTDAPISGPAISQVRVRRHNGTIWGSYVTLTAPGGSWTWQKVSDLEARSWTTGIGGGATEIYADGDSGGTSLGSPISGSSLVARIEVEVTSTVLNKISETDPGFTAGHPFISGVAKDFTVQAGDALTNGLTHYWRVRAKDPTGSNSYGAWSTTRSFVVNAPTAALSGTITANIIESDVVTGGKTIILTLTGDTWIAAGAASFDLQRQNIINGLTSAQSETMGWNLVPKALQGVAGVVRTSNTVVTITLDAFATYNISLPETITATIPATALVGGVAIVASPGFTVKPFIFSTRSAQLTGQDISGDYKLIFDGTNDKASVGAGSNVFLGLANGTIEFKFKTSYSAGYQKFLKTDTSDIDIGISQNFGGGARVFAEIAGAGNVGEFDTGNYADGIEHHVAVSWDGTNIRAFIDGVWKKTIAQTGTQNNSAATLYLGHSNGIETLNGSIDEIRISNIARYTSVAGFTVPTEKFTNDSNTKLLWHLNEGTGLTSTDFSGNGKTLILDATNPPAWAQGESGNNPTRSAQITGQDTINNSRAAQITGSLDTNSARSAQTTGQVQTNDTRGAQLTGVDTSNSSRAAQLTGALNINDSRSAQTTGVSTANNVRSAQATGQLTDSSNRPAQTTGQIAIAEARASQLTGQDTSASNRGAQTTGQLSTSDTRGAQITGQLSDSSNRAGQLTGIDTASSSRASQLTGLIAISDSRPAQVTGQESTSNARAAQVTGAIAVNNARSAQVTGQLSDSNARPAQVSGVAVDNSSRASQVAGADTAVATRPAQVTGQLSVASNRGAEVSGAQTIANNRSAEVRGVLVTTSNRGAQVEGQGEQTVSSNRGAQITGELFVKPYCPAPSPFSPTVSPFTTAAPQITEGASPYTSAVSPYSDIPSNC